MIKAQAKELYKQLRDKWAVRVIEVKQEEKQPDKYHIDKQYINRDMPGQKPIDAQPQTGCQYKPSYHASKKTISRGAKTALWMPELKPGWKRPSFKEFLKIYNISLTTNRVLK